MISFILFNYSLSYLFLFLSFFISHKAVINSASRFTPPSSSQLSSLFLIVSSNSMNNTILETLSLSTSLEEELSSSE